MSSFTLSAMRNSNVAYLNRMRAQIQLDPPYQRQGAVWSVDKKRLLLDSLLNGFDIPKIYLHEHSTPLVVDGRRIRYSLIDGRQRLEAIWGYLDGDFALADDFVLFDDGSTTAAGKTFSELERSDDLLAAFLTSMNLDVCVIRTDDVEMIEEMFSRLNEAVPLNAAEKRNGRGGALRPVVRGLVDHPFFVKKLPFDNTRYRHYDLALKFLLWSDHGGPSDVKKRQLDEFWDAHSANEAHVAQLSDTVTAVLDAMVPAFEDGDRLLANVGMISVYFLSFAKRHRASETMPSRTAFVAFNEARSLDRFEHEEALPPELKDYIEFDGLAQTPNDGYALTFRLGVLERFLDKYLGAS